MKKIRPQKLYLVIVIFILFFCMLSACDPPGFVYLSASKIFVINEMPYLQIEENCSWGISCLEYTGEDHFFFSKDNGQTWNAGISIPTSKKDYSDDSEKIRKNICLEFGSDLCYRISGDAKIEMSTDSGKTWQIDWEMPPGRQEFMQRNPDFEKFLTVEPDIIPHDIGVIINDDFYTVIVPIGNQGILVKNSKTGTWKRIAVLTSTKNHLSGANPMPFTVYNPVELFPYLRAEIIIGLPVIAFLFVLFLSQGKKHHAASPWRTAFRYTAHLFLGYLIPLYLWGTGIIAHYSVAISLSIVFVLIIVGSVIKKFKTT